MDVFFIVVALILAVAGIVGSIVPGLPGPPLSWAGLLLFSFAPQAAVAPWMLIVTALLCLLITLLDYLVPSVFTKKFGGSKFGVWGCCLGLLISILGMPLGPQGVIGIVFWPFAGAFVGELISGKPVAISIKAAYGSFLGFLMGTFVKVVYATALLIYMIVLLF
ncbi:MAG: DUF456 domain-containing protein [Bacteroidales bacterium]|nr:DUF456 domain-containing protein [Bacteroidales bacterium]